MKRILLFNCAAAMIFALAACAGETAQITEVETGGSQDRSELQTRLSADEKYIPLNQLVIGSMRLEGPNLAVSSEQASELLPLWKAYRSLTQSDTAAQAEIDALIRQIQASMSTDQLEFIQSLEVSPEEIQAMTQDTNQAAGVARNSSGGEFNPREGFEPGGDPGFAPGEGNGEGGGPGFGRSADLNPEQLATMQTAREGNDGFQNRAGALLLDPLIEMLESIGAG